MKLGKRKRKKIFLNWRDNLKPFLNLGDSKFFLKGQNFFFQFKLFKKY